MGLTMTPNLAKRNAGTDIVNATYNPRIDMVLVTAYGNQQI